MMQTIEVSKTDYQSFAFQKIASNIQKGCNLLICKGNRLSEKHLTVLLAFTPFFMSPILAFASSVSKMIGKILESDVFLYLHTYLLIWCRVRSTGISPCVCLNYCET